MNKVILFEEYDKHFLLPLSYYKHVAELQIGCFSIQEKWQAYGFETQLFGRSYLGHNLIKDNSSIFINSHILPQKLIVDEIKHLKKGQALFINGELLAAYSDSLKHNKDDGFPRILPQQNCKRIELDIPSYKKLDYPWDLIRFNSDEIVSDSVHFSCNEENIFIHPSAKISEQLVLDSSNGPIIIDENAEVMPFSYLKGPLYIGSESVVKSHSSITNSSIHRNCRSAGEISTSIQMDFSNKGHDGFMGQSILGSWTNLGAGTTTSNLKNNYSNVKVQYFSQKMELDMQFLGLIMGDHSKSAIGSLFNTASIISVNSNIFGAAPISKFVPAFKWGGQENSESYDIEKAYETAQSVMARRAVKVDREYYKIMNAVRDLAQKFE